MKWNLDDKHTTITFSVKHLGIVNVRGSFPQAKGNFETTDAGEFLNASLEIDVVSIHTGEKDRDTHLLSSDFFQADKFKTMNFQSTNVKKISATTYQVEGNFTMLGITKPISFSLQSTPIITDPYGAKRIGFSLETKINRYDWGMQWNQSMDNMGFVVGKEVSIAIDGEIIQ